MLDQLALSLLASILYAFVFYLPKRVKDPEQVEDIEERKIARTLAIGVIVGGVMWSQGIDMTVMAWTGVWGKLSANAVVIALVEKISLFFCRIFQRYTDLFKYMGNVT